MDGSHTAYYKVGYAAYAGIGNDTNAQFFENNDYKLNQFVNVDLTKYCVKNIKFDDNSVTTVNAHYLYVCDGI